MPVIDAFKNLMRKHPKDGSGSSPSSPQQPTGFAPAPSQQQPVQQQAHQQQQQQQTSSAPRHHQQATQPAQQQAASQHQQQQQQQQQAYSARDHATHAAHAHAPPPGGAQQQQGQGYQAYPYGGPQAEYDTANGKKERLPVYQGLEAFQLVEKMGDGAFSNVYKAIDRMTGLKVAVKVVRKYELNSSQHGDKHLNPNFKKRPRVTERANILKEVQIMRGTDHPSIIKLISFSESAEHYFLVLELMEGGELFHQIVKLTYFSEQLSRHVILQVAHGIRYLHEERGVVHRDIKPENILFERLPIVPSRTPVHRQYDEEKEDEGEFAPGVGGGGIGRVKIADFGLSKIVWAEDTATPCGTVGYTAPEIVKDERYSKSVDMWALGCVLYTLLCGFPPFYDESIAVLTEKVARGYYTFLSPWWDEISASAKDLITHLLCVDPAQRYTIDEFLAHPWCNEQPPPQSVAQAYAQPAAQQQEKAARSVPANAPMDSPLLASMRGPGAREGRSPGLASLKEAFDVANSVHRMEEEGARRRAYNGPGGAGPAGFLQGLNEDDEEAEEEGQVEEVRLKHGDAAAQGLQQRQQQQATASNAATQTQQQQQYHRDHNTATGSVRANANKGGYQPAGGADRKMAEAALYDGRAGQRDRGKQGRAGGFELDMSGATLLGKRAKKPSPLANDGLVPPSSPARHAQAPNDIGSPMRY